MTDRLGYLIWPVLLILVGCAVMARTDAAIVGTPEQPLSPGRHFVVTDTRANTMAACMRVVGVPGHACAFKRAGDTTSTVYISIEDIGPVYKHELFHVAQGDEGKQMNHKGWK